MLNRQKAFNTAYHGLAAQGFQRSLSARDDCAYRGDNGLRCALGYMIPDHIYDRKIEGVGAARLPIEVYQFLGAEKSSGMLLSEDQNFLCSLQDTHDLGFTPENMKERLEEFARCYSLTIPQLPVNASAPASEDAAVERITINA